MTIMPFSADLGDSHPLERCFRSPGGWEITANTRDLRALMIDLIPGDPTVVTRKNTVRLIRGADIASGSVIQRGVRIAYDLAERFFIIYPGGGNPPIRTDQVGEYRARPR